MQRMGKPGIKSTFPDKIKEAIRLTSLGMELPKQVAKLGETLKAASPKTKKAVLAAATSSSSGPRRKTITA